MVFSFPIKRFFPYLILAVLSLGLILRLQNFSMLPYDAHPMRQTDTETVAYNFAFKTHNFLLPENNLIRPVENTHSYFFLELPVYEYLAGIGYTLFGYHIEVIRVFNLILFGVSFLSLFYLARGLFDKYVAVLATLFFSLAPAAIFFIGHAVHPDVFMTTTLLVSLASYLKWTKSKNKNILFFVASVLTLGISAGTRPFVLICLPAFWYLMWSQKAQIWEYPVMILGSITPFGLWKLWQQKFPEASTDYENWVLRGRAGLFDLNVLVNRLILKNVVGEVFGKVISLFGVWGIIVLVKKLNPGNIFLLLWLLMIPVYWVIVPAGNITHQYYSNVFLLPVIMTAAVGVNQLLKFIYSKKIIWGLVLVLIVGLTLFNGVRTSQYYFNNSVASDLLFGLEIEKNIPVDSKLVFLADNPTPISLFHRRGWMVNNTGVDVAPNAAAILRLKDLGAKYLVEPVGIASVSEAEMQKIRSQVTQVYSSSLVTIYKF